MDNFIKKIINSIIAFINKCPRLKVCIYSIIASAFEGRMADFMFVEYMYYISTNVVEAIIQKHPRYFFGAFFRKHVSKLTLRGFILREFLRSYLAILLDMLVHAERQARYAKRNQKIRAEMYMHVCEYVKNVCNKIMAFIRINGRAIAINIIRYFNFM